MMSVNDLSPAVTLMLGLATRKINPKVLDKDQGFGGNSQLKDFSMNLQATPIPLEETTNMTATRWWREDTAGLCIL
jgi:hypothetical protein